MHPRGIQWSVRVVTQKCNNPVYMYKPPPRFCPMLACTKGGEGGGGVITGFYGSWCCTTPRIVQCTLHSATKIYMYCSKVPYMAVSNLPTIPYICGHFCVPVTGYIKWSINSNQGTCTCTCTYYTLAGLHKNLPRLLDITTVSTCT